MITTEFARTMARYNRWQNQSLTDAANTLSDAARWQDQGAFFGSIAATLNHILWDYRIWLARLQGNTEMAAQIAALHPYTDTPQAWSDYKRQRVTLDDEIVDWADTLTDKDIAQFTLWIRGIDKVATNFGFNFAHMINHQTHHRGQVHAMLTRLGATPQPTDLQMLKVIGADADTL